MKSICFLGECMVELRSTNANTMHQSFAGDVYNSAVYLKRCFPEVQTSLATAVGKDILSQKMTQVFEQENIDTSLVFPHPVKAPGMYLIETDEAGERSFTYWRSDAAARKVMDFFSDELISKLVKLDVFFFSGISLAVIEPDSREKFFETLLKLKSAGVSIVFDPNYRPVLWKDEDEARSQFDKAFAVSNTVLPGIEDLEVLYKINTSQALIEHCLSYGIEEIIVKDGPNSVLSCYQSNQSSHTIVPVENVVDTTSAGDAFNGTYLGARLSGQSIDDAIQMAAKAAGIVIQHKGAIAPKFAFEQALINS